MDKDKLKKLFIWIGIVLGTIGVVYLCVLLPLSYSRLQLEEYGLYHTSWSERVYYDPNQSESGLYYTGLQGSFVKFPRTKCLIEFRDGYDGKPDGVLKGGGNSLQAFTSEGANVYVEASYYFSVRKDKILAVYEEYGDYWQSFLIRLSFGVLKSTTVLFSTNDFVTNSAGVSSQMKENLAAAFRSNFSEAITLDNFYLQKISFDDTLDTAINAKLIQAYRKKSYTFQQNITVTQKQTEQIVQAINNQIRITNATNGLAPAISYDYAALGTNVVQLASNMTTGYTWMKNNLTGITNPQLWRLMYVTELKVNNFSNVTKLNKAVTKTISST